MASPEMIKAIEEAASAPDKAAALLSLFTDLKSLTTPTTISADLKAILDATLEASVGLVATRQAFSTARDLLTFIANHEVTIEVCTYALSLIANHNPSSASSYIEQGASLSEQLATAYERSDDFLAAARALSEIPLDSSQRKVGNEERARIWVRIVRNYLEEDDSTSAELYLNKLKNVMHTVDDPELKLHFRLSQARINDSRRQFLSASQAYHEISLSPAIAEDDRLHTLGMAVKCAILAPAGPTRSRALGRLYKDERAAGLEEFVMLEKMFLDRLLVPDEVDKFAQKLAPHQLATTADGSTVLTKAVVEHNLLGASRLYSNIGIDDLGSLLGLDGAKAEETTSRMIEQGRLVGRIDQIDRVIWFEGGEASGKKGSGRAEVVVGKELRRWDANVEAMAEEVENITNALQQDFPVFVAANLNV